ncbi:MAG: hypothetical protein QM802_11055 [Agriterribacter sp.]
MIDAEDGEIKLKEVNTRVLFDSVDEAIAYTKKDGLDGNFTVLPVFTSHVFQL